MEPEKDKLWVIVLIVSAIDSVLFFWFRVTLGGKDLGMLGIAMGIATTLFIQLVIGAVLNNFRKTAIYGKAVLLATCIMLVVGFGICTVNT